ncbi:hypothetical protein MRX96_004181 [Rhipicephalus microplus]
MVASKTVHRPPARWTATPSMKMTACGIELPAKRMNVLKAHRWNDDHGCLFVEPLPVVLRHYEEQCAFHFMMCPRCGNSVRHAALVNHYKTGCHGSLKGPGQDETPQADRNLKSLDVDVAMEEFRSLLKNNHHDHLPTIESKMNEITEQVTNHGALLQEMFRTLRNT